MADTKTDSSLVASLASVQRVKTTLLTHYGRKSGKPYQVQIWFTVDGEHVNLMTMNMKRQWVRNVLANPKISLTIGDQTFVGQATRVTDPSMMDRVVQLMKRKYLLSLPYLWIKKQPDGAFRVQFNSAES
jgi:deazaflavin-dependent oxidoreductase (nitroreductase family)